MEADQPPRPAEQPPGVAVTVAVVLLQPVHHRIVEPQEGQVELRDDQVLVVAGIGDLRDAVDAWQIAPQIVVRRDAHARDRRAAGQALGGGGPDLEPDPVVERGGTGGMPRVERRPVAVEAVQVERRLAQVLQVGDHVGRRRRAQVRPRDVAGCCHPIGVGRQVVVDELAPIGVDRRDDRVPGRRRRIRLDHGGTEPLQVGHDLGWIGGRQMRGRVVLQFLEQIAERCGERDLAHRVLGQGDRFLGAGEALRHLALGRVLDDMAAMGDRGQHLVGRRAVVLIVEGVGCVRNGCHRVLS